MTLTVSHVKRIVLQERHILWNPSGFNNWRGVSERDARAREYVKQQKKSALVQLRYQESRTSMFLTLRHTEKSAYGWRKTRRCS